MPKLRHALLLTTLTAVVAAGCSERPMGYSAQRPPVDQIDPRDSGLQSFDVVAASDKLAMDLMALPEMNRSQTQLTIVFTNVENLTSEPRLNYDIFLERLRVNVARLGRGRVAVIDNRDRVANLQVRELDAPPATTGGIQPNFALYGKITEMPNRRSSYYLATFQLTDLRTRQMIWTDQYEVRVAR